MFLRINTYSNIIKVCIWRGVLLPLFYHCCCMCVLRGGKLNNIILILWRSWHEKATKPDVHVFNCFSIVVAIVTSLGL